MVVHWVAIVLAVFSTTASAQYEPPRRVQHGQPLMLRTPGDETLPDVTERAAMFEAEADRVLGETPFSDYVGDECAAMLITFQREFFAQSPYFRRTGMHPEYTGCDWIVHKWMMRQLQVDGPAMSAFVAWATDEWWRNEMPVMVEKLQFSPTRLQLRFSNWIRDLWARRLAARNLAALEALAGPYLAEMEAGRVKPAWLFDDSLRRRQKLVK